MIDNILNELINIFEYRTGVKLEPILSKNEIKRLKTDLRRRIQKYDRIKKNTIQHQEQRKDLEQRLFEILNHIQSGNYRKAESLTRTNITLVTRGRFDD